MNNPSPGPLVSIIILNWNGLENTLQCIETILQSTYRRYEIIVVDNGSALNPKESIETQFPAVQVVCNHENRGYTGGNNQGIRLGLEKKADYFWLVNNDVVVTPETLGELVRAAETSPQAGLLSPVIYQQESPEKVLWCGSFLDVKAAQQKITKNLDEISMWLEQFPDKVCVWGTASLIPRSVVEKIGFLDDRYFAYWETYDYSFRTIQAGFLNRVVASARIYHHVKEQFPPHYYYYMIRNDYYFWMKYLAGSQKLAFFRNHLARAMLQAGELTRQDKRQQAQASLAGVWDAWRHKFGEWNAARAMPGLLAKGLLAFPGLWTWLLGGNLGRLKKTLRRVDD